MRTNQKMKVVLNDLCRFVDKTLTEESSFPHEEGWIEWYIKFVLDDPICEWGCDNLANSVYKAGYNGNLYQSLFNGTKYGWDFIDRLNEAFKTTDTYNKWI